MNLTLLRLTGQVFWEHPSEGVCRISPQDWGCEFLRDLRGRVLLSFCDIRGVSRRTTWFMAVELILATGLRSSLSVSFHCWTVPFLLTLYSWEGGHRGHHTLTEQKALPFSCLSSPLHQHLECILLAFIYWFFCRFIWFMCISILPA